VTNEIGIYSQPCEALENNVVGQRMTRIPKPDSSTCIIVSLLTGTTTDMLEETGFKTCIFIITDYGLMQTVRHTDFSLRH